MPANLDPGDRKILAIGGTILLLLIVVTAAFSPSEDEGEGQGIPTTYSTASGGAQAAYILLGELGYRTERWEKPPTDLPTDTHGTILILAGPSTIPNQKERDALLSFVRSGGWIIYSGDAPHAFLEAGGVEPASVTPESILSVDTFSAVAPSLLTSSASKISMNARDRWSATDGSQVPLYGKPDEPVVVTWRLGTGRVVWWAAATPLTNAGISREGNLPFLLGCIQAIRPSGNAGEITVLWDEYFHGYRGSLWDYFQKTPLPWAIFQLGMAAIFVLLAFARRSGPIYSPPAPSRLSPLEFVDTLGDLYRRAGAGSAAVRVAYQRFRTQLVRRLALAPSISNAQLDAAVRERLNWKQPGFVDMLQRADRAMRQVEVPGSEALLIVQALEHYEVLFGLKSRPNEEKL